MPQCRPVFTLLVVISTVGPTSRCRRDHQKVGSRRRENPADYTLRAAFRYGPGRSQGADRLLAHAQAGAKADAGIADLGSPAPHRCRRGMAEGLWTVFYPARHRAKSGIERGKYLTEHVAICGDCNTPRSSIG